MTAVKNIMTCGAMVLLLLCLLFLGGCSGGNESAGTMALQEAGGTGGSASTGGTPAAPNPYPTNPPAVTGLVITGIEPAILKAGDACTIRGSGFGASRGARELRTVQFGGVNATTYNHWSDTLIECIVPGNAPVGLITITVTITSGTESISASGLVALIGSTVTPGSNSPAPLMSPTDAPTPAPSPTASTTPSPTPSSTPSPSSTMGYALVDSFGTTGVSAGTRTVEIPIPAPGPGQLTRPIGIARDSSGNMYVADLGNNRIQKFDSAGSPLTQWGSVGSTTGLGSVHFNGPFDIAIYTFNSVEYVYVTDTYNNRIQKFATDGTFVSSWGTQGSGDTNLYWPVGVAANANGVYVTDLLNNRVLQFDQDGVLLRQLRLNNGEMIFNWPAGIDVDSSGNVYIADSGNNCIKKFDRDLTYSSLSSWGTRGSGNGQFITPYGVSVDPKFDNVFVADRGNNRIQQFTSAGVYKTKWGSTLSGGSGTNDFLMPMGVLAFTDATNGETVCVGDYGNNRVVVCNFSVNYLTDWSTNVGNKGAPVETSSTPWSVAVNSTNTSIYSTDTQAHRSGPTNYYYIKAYGIPDGSTDYTCQARSSGVSTNRFLAGTGNVGMGIGLDSQTPNRIFVANTGTTNNAGRIDRGATFTSWTNRISSNLNRPDSVAVDAAGNIYVANTRDTANPIRKFTTGGTLVAGQSWSPSVTTDTDIAVGAGTNPPVYVIDRTAGSVGVRKYTTANGTAYNGSALVIGQGMLTTPQGIGLDASGILYVTDTNAAKKGVYRFATDGTYLGKWSAWTGGTNPVFDTPNDVCSYSNEVTSTYNIYVADAGARDRIVKFEPTFAYTSFIGNDGILDGKLQYPTGIAVSKENSPFNRAYVVDRNNNRIQRFDYATTPTPGYYPTSKIGTLGSGDSQFSSPFGIALETSGSTDYLYVADAGNSRIVTLTCDVSTGGFTWIPSVFASTFATPGGVAVDASYIYVADTFHHQIKIFNKSDKSLYSTIGTTDGGSAVGQFSYPYGVAVDSSGNIFVIDTNNNRVQEFKTDHTIVTWGQGGDAPEDFNSPMGIAVDADGNVFVADTANSRWKGFLNSGGSYSPTPSQMLGSFGSGSDPLDVQFYNPFCCALDGERIPPATGEFGLYITDTFNSRVQKFH
jgi:sugar lactone lactonase YvrE